MDKSLVVLQVSGTDQLSPIPFFVAATDYTLIGEELFAASAYLSQDEKMLGSLKGQDFGKAVAMTSIGLGTFLVTLGTITGARFLGDAHGWLSWLWSGG